MSTGLEEQIEQLLRQGVEEQTFPGAVWAVGGSGDAVLYGTVGVLDPERPAEPMRLATIFDMASLTKIMAVWAAAGVLWEQGQLDLDEPLGSVMPDVAGYPLAPVTVHQLLTHTAGVPLRANLRALYGTQREDIHRGVLRETLHRQPGTAVEYTDRAALIMGLVVEHLNGAALNEICAETVWGPLGMNQSRFGPLPATLIGQAAPTERDLESGERLRGVAHDYSARLLGGVCGIAGVFSTLGDVETFLQHLIADGGAAETSFGSRWVEKSLQIHTGGLEPARGLFWHPAPGVDPSEGLFAHYGFTGTAMWVNREQGRWAALLTNKLYYSREREAIARIRDAFCALAFRDCLRVDQRRVVDRL
ncbi:serine hydrolase domain-containing protein [Microtetraspora malaysiensis]|uniref:serine hydrolase domain-containing protein n=1 Tax=Microtetraspora malaysiensis TaxID=161358 RepID=UPI00082D2E54|nr:serine hydrolase domain-containing protein [Microtetraspora malaysiensis]